MQEIRLTDLNPSIQSFLTQVCEEGTVVVDVDGTKTKIRLTAYQDSTPEERAVAWKDIQKIQERVGESMRAQGITEADIDRELQSDD
jgi:hypothetical protein